MSNKKFVSKVDEKLKAAEARRAELERAKTAEQNRKQEMRRNRVTAGSTSTTSSSFSSTKRPKLTVPTAPKINVRDFGYLRVGNCDDLIKLNWRTVKKKKKTEKGRIKLFTIVVVDKLIQSGEFDVADVILGIMKKSVPARHPIQNKFARLHGCIVECKERDKRAFTHASALNFTGSISPVRLPEFEIDLDKLSRLSSPIGMQEIAGKYENIEELRVNEDREFERAMQGRSEPPEFDTCNYNPYDHDLIPDDYAVTVEQKKRIKSVDENDQQTNFPAVISPMKRPQKDIEADVVYTPQRKSARRLGDDEIIYDDEQVSQILLNDPNAAFISNPYITTPSKKNRKQEE